MELSYGKFLQLVIKKNDRFCYRLQNSPYFCTCQELKRAVEASGGHPQNWFWGKKRRWNKNNSNTTTTVLESIFNLLHQFLNRNVYNPLNIIIIWDCLICHRWFSVPRLQLPRSDFSDWKRISNATACPYLWRTVRYYNLFFTFLT